MKKPTQPHHVPQAILDEMERLTEISPLLSPSIGWPRFKGGDWVETRISFKFATEVDERLDTPSEPWGGPETDPELRDEINRAMRGILGEMEKLQVEALKAAGWELTHLERGHVHHHAALWTKDGKQVGIMGYLPRRVPSVIWTPDETAPRGLRAACYAAEVVVALVGAEGTETALREVCLALGKRLRRPRMTARTAAAIRQRVLAPEEVAWDMPDGLPVVHVYLDAKGELPAQHVRFLESVIGQVRVVEHNVHDPERPLTGILSLGQGMPNMSGAVSRWLVDNPPEPGSLRLESGDLTTWACMEWTETVGPGETVAESTVAILLACSQAWKMSGAPERHAIFLSLGAEGGKREGE